MNMRVTTVACLGAAALTLAGATSAQAGIIDGVRTIFLDAPQQNWGQPMNVAYDPNFGQYYSGGGGFTENSGFVYDSAGNLIQDSSVVVDLRAFYHNPNTGLLEAVTFDARGGGSNRGLRAIGLDGSGFYDGTSSPLLSSMPGLIDSQTMPAYNPNANVLYSASFGSQMNVVDRANGNLLSTVALDLGGGRSNTSYALGYDPNEDWVIVADNNLDEVHVFDSAGAFLGSAAIDIDMTNPYGFGYANGQVFVWDAARVGWQGYTIGAVPAPGVLAILALGPIGLRRRRRA